MKQSSINMELNNHSRFKCTIYSSSFRLSSHCYLNRIVVFIKDESKIPVRHVCRPKIFLENFWSM